MEVEKVTPYGSQESKTGQVSRMFDNIAPAYDFMDRAMTLGLDIRWRKKAARIVARHAPKSILDVATGTGDLAIALARMVESASSITGIDLSEGMLEVAMCKSKEAGLEDKITFLQGDCMQLPMADSTFGTVTAAFGVRNFEHLELGLAEMQRVLAPGGLLCIMELSTPTNPVVKPFYHFYTRVVIPIAGKIVSRDRRAYTYLPESIAAMPQGDEMLQILRSVGFVECRCRRFTFGVCSLYTAIKP